MDIIPRQVISCQAFSLLLSPFFLKNYSRGLLASIFFHISPAGMPLCCAADVVLVVREEIHGDGEA
jgi:hypothetical protein